MKSIGRDKIPGVSKSFGQEFSKKSENAKRNCERILHSFKAVQRSFRFDKFLVKKIQD